MTRRWRKSVFVESVIGGRRPEGRPLLHPSDRRCPYTSAAYQQTLATLGIASSMSLTGCCHDHAAMERFYWYLQHELTGHETSTDLHEAGLSVFPHIDLFYNRQRLHQALGYLSPEQCEAVHAPATKVAQAEPVRSPPSVGHRS
jgi:putative transposase